MANINLVMNLLEEKALEKIKLKVLFKKKIKYFLMKVFHPSKSKICISSNLDELKTNKDYIFIITEMAQILNIRVLHLILLVGLQLMLRSNYRKYWTYFSHKILRF